MKNFFMEVIPKMIVWEEIHKELPENILGTFGEIREIIFSTPKYLPAPTPMNTPNITI